MSRSSRTARSTYVAVRSEGGLLSHDFLESIGALAPELEITPAAYFLADTEPLAEAQSRSWLRLIGLWRAFQEARQKLPEGDPAVRLTRERWLLPLFAELGYGRLKAPPAPIEAEGRTFPLSHLHGPVCLHLMGAGVDLDRPTSGVTGAARTTPHGLLQDLLNRSDPHLWGLVTNGLTLRVLRDFRALTRQAFLEFDLESIFDGERFSDFRLLWLVCHASRLSPAEATPGDPTSAPIESWYQRAKTAGVRVLERLRGGVKAAIEHLGAGLLRHPHNRALHDSLRSGALSTGDYYRQLLRLIYRLIFIFVAEDRDLLLPELQPTDPPEQHAAQARYRRFYATTRLRDLALRRRGGPHSDLWRALNLLLSKLYAGCPELGLPPFGSFLFSPQATPDLDRAQLHNHDLLAALLALCTFTEGNVRRQVSWRSIGADELGSVYESFLELHPEIHRDAATFTLHSAAGNDRKTSGSYYTPHTLVESLLDTALTPVLDRAAAAKHPEAALLALRVCDPACGSGHFLTAAGRRLAHRLAQARAGDAEPSPELVRSALRDVFSRCLFGVDHNPMAVELCKISLWLEAIDPGRALPFLDSHILHGNSLLGATPALLARGIPDDAFKEIEGDDKTAAKALRRRNRDERAGKAAGVQHGLFAAAAPTAAASPDLTQLTREAAAIDRLPDDTLAAAEAKERRYHALQTSSLARDAHLVADVFTAAFVWPKQGDPAGQRLQQDAPTEWLFRKIHAAPHSAPPLTRDTAEALRREYNFFHWHIAFPQVFTEPPPGEQPQNPKHGWNGGFDLILGNPPWERIKLQEQEFFATRAPKIATAANAAARKKTIANLAAEDPTLWSDWQEAVRKASGESHLLRTSGRFPLCGRGDINTYAVFAELDHDLLAPHGYAGIITPAGIAMDDTTKDYFADLINGQNLASLYHFENESLVFPGVHHAYRFVLLTLTGLATTVQTPTFAAFARQVEHIHDPDRRYTLTADDFTRLNPNTRTFPAFRWRIDAEINRSIYRRVPVLLRTTAADPDADDTEHSAEANPWGVTFKGVIAHGQRLRPLPHPRAARSRRLAAPGQRLPARRPRCGHHRCQARSSPLRGADAPALRGQDDPPLRSSPRHLRRPDRGSGQPGHPAAAHPRAARRSHLAPALPLLGRGRRSRGPPPRQRQAPRAPPPLAPRLAPRLARHLSQLRLPHRDRRHRPPHRRRPHHAARLPHRRPSSRRAPHRQPLLLCPRLRRPPEGRRHPSHLRAHQPTPRPPPRRLRGAHPVGS
jgi:hypothetical protein